MYSIYISTQPASCDCSQQSLSIRVLRFFPLFVKCSPNRWPLKRRVLSVNFDVYVHEISGYSQRCAVCSWQNRQVCSPATVRQPAYESVAPLYKTTKLLPLSLEQNWADKDRNWGQPSCDNSSRALECRADIEVQTKKNSWKALQSPFHSWRHYLRWGKEKRTDSDGTILTDLLTQWLIEKPIETSVTSKPDI